MVLNLFIDTNVLLSFYHFADEDLEELKKLVVLVEKEQVKLFVPAQVCDEFKRNRDTKLADALKGLREQKMPKQFPQVCKDYQEYSQLRDLQKQYEQKHSSLVQKLAKDASSRNLKADKIIDALFAVATIVKIPTPFIERAKLRAEIGNPPGKSGSLGDALNWECLLEEVPYGEPLHFITDDGDYASPLDSATFNTFLLDEWSDKKGAQLVSYARISAFFAAEFPQIKLASEIEKEQLISELFKSPNFLHTHSIVAKLRKFPEFSADQANSILTAAVQNNQVGWIASDWDVRELLKAALSGKSNKLDQELVTQVFEMMGPEPEPPDEIPFRDSSR